MNIDPIILSIPIYFLLIVAELLIQFFNNQKIYRLNDAVTNISCGITQQITGAFFKVTTIAAYQFVYENWSLFRIENTWWSVTLLILAVDLCYYWAHRMSHEVNLFWGGHVVHHQSEDYNFSVALRQGSFQILWTFWFYIPLAFLGFNTVTFLIVLALNTVYQFWIHTETIGKLPRPIEFIFNTPSHHRVHHGRNPKYIDKNHAGSLIIWDRMFGTFQEEEERPTYGITKPINTWNPVWANLQHYIDMVSQLRSTPGLMNKLGVMFNKPGWRPVAQGGYQSAPEVDKVNYRKYDTHPAFKMSLYVLVQFIITLAVTSAFLFTLADQELINKLIFSLVIVWSVAQFGLLLDNHPEWSRLEYLRILLCGGVFAFLYPYPLIIILSITYIGVALISFFFIYKPAADTVGSVINS